MMLIPWSLGVAGKAQIEADIKQEEKQEQGEAQVGTPGKGQGRPGMLHNV